MEKYVKEYYIIKVDGMYLMECDEWESYDFPEREEYLNIEDYLTDAKNILLSGDANDAEHFGKESGLSKYAPLSYNYYGKQAPKTIAEVVEHYKKVFPNCIVEAYKCIEEYVVNVSEEKVG